MDDEADGVRPDRGVIERCANARHDAFGRRLRGGQHLRGDDAIADIERDIGEGAAYIDPEAGTTLRGHGHRAVAQGSMLGVPGVDERQRRAME